MRRQDLVIEALVPLRRDFNWAGIAVRYAVLRFFMRPLIAELELD
jgi:hypothetical protein